MRAVTLGDMSESSRTEARFSTRVRSMLRDQLIEAAEALALARPWSEVTMADVARAVGVSRQTLYNEFGSKDGLGEAMAYTVAERLATQAADEIERHDDLLIGVEAALTLVLRQADGDPMVRAVLSAARQDDELLPFLTTRSGVVLDLATTLLADRVGSRAPDLTRAQVRVLVDTAVRLVVSHIVQPGGSPQDVAALITWILGRSLGMGDGSPLPA